MSQLTLSFLGRFEALLEDTPLTHFRSVKAQGLLIYLSLNPQQAHSRSALAALFWPDESEQIAKQNLRQILSRLRQLLGDTNDPEVPYLLATRSAVRFNPASRYILDVSDFHTFLEQGQLEGAIQLYRGDLLSGFSCDSLPFDAWLRSERERLHQLVLGALYELTSENLARANYQSAQRLAHRQLALEPWREEAHRQLMQALALQGNRSAALAQFESCRKVLKEELGIEPSLETTTLAAYIRERPFDQRAKALTDLSPQRPRLTIPFVGREVEFRQLTSAYQQAVLNQLRVVWLGGRAGIGKTRLAQHFLEWAAAQGADILVGRAYENSSGLSYHPLTHLLRERLERENAPEDLLSDFWLSQLARLLPELRDRYPDLPQPMREESTARQHLFESITRVLQALAMRCPLVLLIDDWHWADAASLELLSYALNSWASKGLPILVLLTLRQEALTELPEVQSWLKQVEKDVAARELFLNELSETDTGEMVRMLLRSKAAAQDQREDDRSLTRFTHWLFADTNGQPLFLTETLKTLVEDGIIYPQEAVNVWQVDWQKLEDQADGSVFSSLNKIISGWLDRIGPSARGLLTAASVLAQDATFHHLLVVSTLGEAEGLEALDELLEKQLLLEVGGTASFDHNPIYAFSHQKVSDVVYQAAGRARRRSLHRRAYDSLLAEHATAADLAQHAYQAGMPEETVQHSLNAAADAMALVAHQVATPHFERVKEIIEGKGWPDSVSETEKWAYYTGLGKAYELNIDWIKAQQTYEAMLGNARRAVNSAMEWHAINRLAIVHINGLDKPAQALKFLKEALELAEQREDQRGLAETYLNLTRVSIQIEDYLPSIQYGDKALSLARELNHPDLLARSLFTMSMRDTVFLRQWEKGLAYLEEAYQLHLAAGNQLLAAETQRGIGLSHIFLGHPRKGLSTLEEAFPFFQEIEYLWLEADVAWMMGLAWQEAGHYGNALKFIKLGMGLMPQVGVPMLMLLSQITLGRIMGQLMAFDEAELALQKSFSTADERGYRGFVVEWSSAELCALYGICDDWEQAYHYAKRGLDIASDISVLPMSFSLWFQIEALLRGGDVDMARAEVERIDQIVGDNLRFQLPLLRSRAVLAKWDGDIEQAIVHLEAALALARGIGLPGEEWPILGELGGLYREHGEPEEGIRCDSEAALIIHRLANSIDDDILRVGFLTASPIRSILER